MRTRAVNGSEQLSGTLIFLGCGPLLNAAPVTNAFLKSDVSFFYILTTFLFYKLLDNVLMKTYPLCGRRGDKKTFKETKISGVICK